MRYRNYCVLVAVITCVVILVGILLIVNIPPEHVTTAHDVLRISIVFFGIAGVVEACFRKRIAAGKWSIAAFWVAGGIFLGGGINELWSRGTTVANRIFAIGLPLWVLALAVVYTMRCIKAVKANRRAKTISKSGRLAVSN